MSCSPTRAAARALLAGSAALLTLSSSAFALDVPPAKPGQPATVIPGSTFLRLDWDALADGQDAEPVTYEVLRNGAVVANTSRLTATVSGLTPGTAYEFRINARYADGSISTGDPATIKTAASNNPVAAPFACKFPGSMESTHSGTLVVQRLGKKVWPAGQPVQEGPRRLALYLEDNFFAPSPWPTLGAATVEPATPQANTLGVLFNWADEASHQTLTAPVTLPAAPQPVARGKRAVVIESTTALSVNTTTSGAFYFGGDLKQTLIARNAAGEPLQLDAPDGGPDGNPDTFLLDCKYSSVIPEPGEIDAGFDLVPTEPADTLPPTIPTPLPPTHVSPTSATVNWLASTDNVGVTAYEVRLNGQLVATTPALTTSLLLSGLTPNTSYALTVTARDAAGNATTSLAATFKTLAPTPPPPLRFEYAITGATSLKSLAKGSLGLSGSLSFFPQPATGAFTGDLLLNDTSGRLVAGGFLPLTAKVGFVPSGRTTGSLRDATLKTQTKVRLKVKEVKLFGAIPLYAGNSCQTKSFTDLNLASAAGTFDPFAGGTLAGTYAISDLNGCGALNGLVSPLTAGSGNTITLKLTRQ